MMPDVNTIPQASVIQTQLALIEQALDALKGGNAAISNLTVTDAPPGVTTRVTFEPPISDADTIANTITTLQEQQTYLISELQSQGYTYTGSAIPPPGAPPPSPFGVTIPQAPPPLPVPPMLTPPGLPPLTEIPPTTPPPDPGSPPTGVPTIVAPTPMTPVPHGEPPFVFAAPPVDAPPPLPPLTEIPPVVVPYPGQGNEPPPLPKE